MREMEESLDQDFFDLSDAQILSQLQGLPEYRDAHHVMLFWGVGKEVRTEPLILRALEAGKHVYLPRVTGPGEMEAVEIRSIEELVPGTFSIPEPSKDLKAAPPGALELVVVPGVAFDFRGGRLGRGGGYYDRFLAHAPGALRVGLARERLILRELPMCELDVKMDLVVTELRAVWTGAPERAPAIGV